VLACHQETKGVAGIAFLARAGSEPIANGSFIATRLCSQWALG
jgi:hypothetical protein